MGAEDYLTDGAVPREPGASDTPDLGAADTIDTEFVREKIKNRHLHDAIYTRCGSVMIVTNPFKKMNLFSNAILEQYKNAPVLTELPPHTFAVASTAHRGMVQEGLSQAIIVSGESGAGKTESARHMMLYLRYVCQTSEELETRLYGSDPITEAFGCAKTVRNDNSSRMGKFTTLNFDSGSKIQGATLNTYLLEKTRVTTPGPGERAYHAFYALLRSGEADRVSSLKLTTEPADYFYLNNNGAHTGEPGGKRTDKMLWDELDEALKAGGWTADGLTELWALVAACLHTGNINFDPAKTDTATITADSAKWVENVEAVLGLPGGVLPKVLTKMKMKVGTEMMDKDLTFAKAVDTRDALAKGIFSRLFDKLIEQINTSMAEAKGCDRNATIKNVIGIVDIFGFEIFEKNSMEQLCINFANEKLQALFTKTVFAETMKAYKEEGIDVADITYSDNANLIKTFETPKTGLFGLLTEECILPKGTDEGFTEKVMATHGKGGIIFRMKGVGPKEGFGLNHFAGQVNYGTKAWLDKNRDPMSGDLVQLMLSADNKLLKELFTEKQEADAGGGGGKKKSPKFKGVMDTFTAQLNDLNGTLEKCALHFVRCFKTNDQKKKEFNEDEVVMRQLQTSGVLDALRVSREGYPDRMIFETFSSQYIAVPGLKTAAELAPKPPKERVDTLLERLEVPKEKFRSGKTRVFFAAGVLDGLRAKRTAMQAKIATEIQRVGRGLVARAKARELRKIREAALQAMVAATPGEDIEALRTAIKGAKDAGLPNYPAGKAKFDEAEKRLATLEAELKARKEAEAALEAAVAGTDIPALEAALKKAVDCKSDNKPLIERGEKRVEFLKEEERRAEEERKRKEEEERKLAELKAAAEKDASKKAELEAAQAAAAEAEKKSAAEAAAREAAAAGGDAAIVAQAEQEAEAVKAEEEAKQVAEETAQKTQLVKSQSRMLAEAKADPEHAAVAGDAAASAAASAVANGAGSDEAIKAGIAAAEAAEAEAQERAIQEKAQLRRATIDKLRSEEVKFHSLPEDVVDYADYLGMDLKEDLGLLWIADEALRADDPDGWIEREGPTGDHYYEHEVTGQVLYSHPLDYQFQQLYLEEKKKGGSGQLGRRNSDDDDDDMAPPKQARSSSRAALLAATGPVGSADDVLRRVQRLLGTTRSDELRQLLIQPSLCKTPVRCFVIRHKSFMGTPRFDFFMSISRTDDMYCFTAKKWPLGINKGCYYSISLDQEEAKRSKASTLESGAFVGKVRSDKKSLDYTLYDDGTSPDGKDKGGTSVLRHELLHINFSNSLRNRDPGAMTVVLPEVDSDGSFESVQPRHHTEGLEALLKRGEKGGLLELKNRQPKWNASSNMYVLDFHGRASLPSCRNVQLAPKAKESDVCFLMGKVEENRFNIDFKAPFSAMQAFATAIIIFDNSSGAF